MEKRIFFFSVYAYFFQCFFNVKTIKCNTKNLTSIIKVLISANVHKQFVCLAATRI